ncbi:DUF4870 domain-containing protein [Marinihelvus fidelis]|uniref:DUF4870 domain-containing protein n=1 Tax=Marinihelvus fidelis TaxID=2613842 RepID=A0A5N0TDR7_9GAMM|nr:DUF4870 domain-containing protein [Marinihelvus fidelis]KAA9132604.1 DUF4870 domain-containing protein [Marinihelvus fidelis]
MSEIGPGPETQSTESDTAGANPPPSAGDDRETRQWAMFLHFSVLAGWVVPLAGLIVPIIIWQLKKDDLPGIVPHAHIVMNWIITSLVYGVICFILTFILIGIFGFMALALATIIFSIIGGIKANEGEAWPYPGTIIKVFG